MTELSKSFEEVWSAEDGVRVTTSGGESEQWTNRRYAREGLWAYQPLQNPFRESEQPRDRHSLAFTRNAAPAWMQTTASKAAQIDTLINRRLPEGLAPAPHADRRTLLRRVTFDLIGLPPSAEEIRAFENDSSNDEIAFARVVDRLLESPHYGERMAQHWLDVVRYADSSGFANDYERGNAWRYRDYVIRAFQSDKPYDQFIRQQIAGDEIHPDDSESLIATGFLRMGPWELTGMEVAKIARQRFLDDVTNSVGETFLAHSLQCARCHDHKFDPIPTQDYYSIQAVFATTQLAERSAPFSPNENIDGFDERRFLVANQQRHAATLAELESVLLKNAEDWFAVPENSKHLSRWRETLEEVEMGPSNRKGGRFAMVRNKLMREGIPQEELPPVAVGFTPEQFGNERVARKGNERLKWSLDRYKPFALAVYNGKTRFDVTSVYAPQRIPKDLSAGELENSAVLVGGDPFSPGSLVHPGVLSVLNSQISASVPTSISGRRTALANWIADSNNPLTTRTMANRVWQWHFGRGIAGNPNNFGSTGKRPTHPELLDFLAIQFIDAGWSIKALHRMILMSDTYRRSSNHPQPEAVEHLDPLGESYATFAPRRLSSEELRDAMLAVSGELNRLVGGIPNRPEINREAALQPRQVMGTFAEAWVPNPLPKQRHRRSIYALKLRGLVDPFAEVFNKPPSDFSCEQRDASTVTPQVFSLFNSHASQNRAFVMATRVMEATFDRAWHEIEFESSSDTRLRDLVQRCFEFAYGRAASQAELQICVAHLQALLNNDKGIAPHMSPVPTQIKREAVEENTGERFEFVEELTANTEFVPDIDLTDSTPELRALAGLCLVLLNSNEFVCVY